MEFDPDDLQAFMKRNILRRSIGGLPGAPDHVQVRRTPLSKGTFVRSDMQWYVTVKRGTSPIELSKLVESLGGRLVSERMIPMGEQEAVVKVDGPDALKAQLMSAPIVSSVHPAGEPRAW